MLRQIIALIAVAGLAVSASAEDFQVLGARAMGMGGAGVAVAQGDVAQYWNPGGLAQSENTSGLQIPFDAHVQYQGPVIQGANDVFNVFSACSHGSAQCTSANINNALGELDHPGEGALAAINAMVGLKIGKFQLGIINETEAGATPLPDLTNVNTGGGCNVPNPSPALHCFQDNTSALAVSGGAFTSANLSYAHSFFVPGLTVGATIKAIYGDLGFNRYAVTQNQAKSADFYGNLSNETKGTVEPAFDLGALWDVSKFLPVLPFHPKVGLVGRNLNNPSFDNPATAIANGSFQKTTLDRQIRAGVELSPFHWWNFAADLDLTKNNTFLPGLQQQMAAVGTEINVFNRSWINIPLRVGLNKDLATSGSKPNVTAGVGLNFLHLIVDLGGQINTQKIPTNGTTQVPSYASVGVQVAIMF